MRGFQIEKRAPSVVALPTKSGNEPQKAQRGHRKHKKGEFFVPFVAPFCASSVPSPICWAKLSVVPGVAGRRPNAGFLPSQCPCSSWRVCDPRAAPYDAEGAE